MDKQVDSNILNLDIKPLNIVFIYLVFNYASISTGSFYLVDLVYNTTLLSCTGLTTPYNYFSRTTHVIRSCCMTQLV